MEILSGEHAKRRIAKLKKAKTLKAKLHAINTGVVKAGRPRFDKQRNMSTLHQFDRGFRLAAVSIGTLVGSAAVTVKVLNNAAKVARFTPGALVLGKLISDASKPNQAQIVHNKRQNALGADKKRKIRAKTGEGNIFQRALDFDAVEYFSGDYSGKPKAKPVKTVSLSKALASKSRTKKAKTSTSKDKRSSPQNKGERRKRYITVRKKGGGTYRRKNPHYGKR